LFILFFLFGVIAQECPLSPLLNRLTGRNSSSEQLFSPFSSRIRSPMDPFPALPASVSNSGKHHNW
jgi:hypothetical protein